MANIEPYFKIMVDGKEYGPYPSAKRFRFHRLEHKKGVEFVDFFMEPPPKEKKAKKQKVTHPSLLDGLDWHPMHKDAPYRRR